MDASRTGHLPDLGKTFLAIVEYYIDKVIGEDARDEIKQPYEQKTWHFFLINILPWI